MVGPIQSKATPVILTTPEEYEVWLNAPTEEALKRQSALADDVMMIAAKGAKADKPDLPIG